MVVEVVVVDAVIVVVVVVEVVVHSVLITSVVVGCVASGSVLLWLVAARPPTVKRKIAKNAVAPTKERRINDALDILNHLILSKYTFFTYERIKKYPVIILYTFFTLLSRLF